MNIGVGLQQWTFQSLSGLPLTISLSENAKLRDAKLEIIRILTGNKDLVPDEIDNGIMDAAAVISGVEDGKNAFIYVDDDAVLSTLPCRAMSRILLHTLSPLTVSRVKDVEPLKLNDDLITLVSYLGIDEKQARQLLESTDGDLSAAIALARSSDYLMH